MERIVYSKEKMEVIHQKVQDLFKIVSELESEFPERHFTLDGHLLGSVGEVLAAYYYGIDLYKSSAERHDGVKCSREVQIKITQQDNVMISSEPEYLIVLYLTRSGGVYEVYNGPGKEPWDTAGKPDSHNHKHMRVNKLMKLDEAVNNEDRISAVNAIGKMKKEYKNGG